VAKTGIEGFQTLDLSESESAFGIYQKKRPEGERQKAIAPGRMKL
jgi:hypothetical protein